MRLKDFSYNFLKQNFLVRFEKWYLETKGLDSYVEKRIPDINIRAKIKSVAKKLRDKNYNFTLILLCLTIQINIKPSALL